MAVKLYLLRHGETEASISGQYVGSGSDVALTPGGMKMAEQFGEAYKDTHWRAVFCSPALRTRQTVAPLARSLTHPVEYREGLWEINYGSWELKSAEEIRASDPDSLERFLEDGEKFAPPGGETVLDVWNRLKPILEEVQSQFSDGNVLFVSHRTTLRVLLCALLGVELKRYRKSFDYPVCSVSMVELRKEGALLVLHGARSHLKAE